MSMEQNNHSFNSCRHSQCEDFLQVALYTKNEQLIVIVRGEKFCPFLYKF